MSANKDIIDYYTQTEFDYKVAWYSKDNPALHFGIYDKEEADSHYEALNHTNKFLAEQAKVKDGDKILDAGCGLGGSVFWLAKNYAISATGISLSGRQIKDCTERANELKLDNKTNFVEADYTNTPFPDESFDVIWACESICHARQKLDFFEESFRLLKPGGRLVVADYIREKRDLSDENEDLLKRKWLKNWIIDDIDTKSEYLDHLEKSGFINNNIENLNNRVAVSLRNLHEKCARSYPIEWVLKLLGIRSSVQHGNLVGSINQYKAFKKELWFYGIITATKATK